MTRIGIDHTKNFAGLMKSMKALGQGLIDDEIVNGEDLTRQERVLRLHANGLTTREIGALEGVHHTTVVRDLNRAQPEPLVHAPNRAPSENWVAPPQPSPPQNLEHVPRNVPDEAAPAFIISWFAGCTRDNLVAIAPHVPAEFIDIRIADMAEDERRRLLAKWLPAVVEHGAYKRGRDIDEAIAECRALRDDPPKEQGTSFFEAGYILKNEAAARRFMARNPARGIQAVAAGTRAMLKAEGERAA